MGNEVDARGLSCPEPVLMAKQAMKKYTDEPIVVMTDTVTSRENVLRTAEVMGFSGDFEKTSEGDFRIVLSKTQERDKGLS